MTEEQLTYIVNYVLGVASEHDKIMYTKDAEQMKILENEIIENLKQKYAT